MFIEVARKDEDRANRRMAFEKLHYPEDRDVFIGVVRKDEDRAIRRMAFEKLHYPEDVKVFTEIACKDEDKDLLSAKIGIASAVSKIREVTRSNMILLQANYRYGFYRNMLELFHFLEYYIYLCYQRCLVIQN